MRMFDVRKRRQKNVAALSVRGLDGVIAARTRTSMAFTMGGQLVRVLVNLIALVVLSRLLVPDEFGVFATAAILINLTSMFAEPGLVASVVQAEKVRVREVSTLYLINSLFGIGLFILTLFLSGFYAAAVEEPKVKGVVQALALVFIWNGLSAQFDAVLRRRMAFEKIVIVNVLSSIFGVCAAIVSASLGASYWALAIQLIVGDFVRFVGLAIVSPWKPWPLEPLIGVSRHIKFGLKLVAGNIVNAVSNSLTPLFIKSTGTLAEMGYWNRTRTLSNIPVRQLVPALFSVLVPAFARLYSDNSAFKSALNTSIRRVSYLAFFFFVCMYSAAEPIVMLMLGDGWTPAIIYLQLLSVMAATEPIARLLSSALVASGMPGRLLWWRIISLSLLLPALIVGANYGVLQIVIAFVTVNAVARAPLFIVYGSYFLNLSIVGVFQRMILPLIAAVTACFASLTLLSLFELSDILAIVLVGVCSSVVFLTIMLFGRSSRADLLSLITYFASRI